MDRSETGYKHIVRTPGFYSGKPCIDTFKIAIHDVAEWIQQGYQPEELSLKFGLTLGQVYGALSYYYDHQEEIDRENEVEAGRVKGHADADTSTAAERMRQALAGRRKRAAHE